MILKKSCQLLALFVCLWTFNTGFVQEEHGQVTAILGENVILHCAFEFPDGAPVPYVIQWQKNGIKIPIYIWYDGYPPHIGEGYEDRVSLAEQASLNLTSVRESDQGWYECKVYFLNRPPDSPKNGTWVRLDVHAPPHFKTKPPDVVYVKVGESVSLPCEAEGTPPPAIIWYKDNLPLEESATVQIFATELRISNLRQSDIGDYLCMARNREGSVTTASKVIVAGPAVITTRPRNITKLEGDKAEFICEAKALPSNVTHRWFHNSVEISQLSWLETRTLLRRDGTLFINPTSAEDSGEYTCEVTNGIGNPDQASAYLSVEYPARVTYSPTIQYLPLGLSGIVRCYVQANPPFQFITWTKDRRPFDPNANPGIVTLNNGSLVFQRVSHEHQGRYRCTPYNIHGTAGTSNVMEVLVREPPMFTVKPKETYQQSVNSEVKLPCDGIGQPKPTITWRRADGGKLPRDRTVVRGGNLTIKGLRKEDHGRYECVLENEIATLVTSTLLLVESTTPHAPTNVSVNTSAFAATLTWLPAYDGGYEQTYVIWYRLAEQSDSDWRTIRVYPEGATTFTLYNLQPDVEYDFQVLSRNVLGDGKFSPTVRARTKQWDYLNGIYPTDAYGSTYIPTVQKPSGTSEPSVPVGPKPGPPRNVTIQDTPQGILISWLPPANTSIRVAYYYVEYKTGRQNWQRWGPIKDGATQYLAKDLPAGQVYHFRVYAFSLMSVGEVSAEVRYQIPGDAQRQNRAKAITAGVVGGILFFIAAIVLSVCAVKICNKRKRRKAEKAYMMVTCPVADARNGGHSHAGSPVPLKKHEESGVSGLAVTALRVLSHCLANLLGHHHDSRTTFASTLPPEDWPPSPEPAPSPPRGRRFPKAVKYNVEMEFSRPLGWISRTAEGKFVLRGEADEGRGFAATNRDAHDLNPSSIRGSLRSDGSGQSMLMSPGIGNHHHLHPHRSLQPSSSMTRTFSSPHRTQYSFSPTSQALPTIYSPRDPRFRTSSPGPLAAGPLIIEDLSSVNQPSSAERSFPSTLSSHLASLSAQVTPSYELPSLRLLHENSNVRGPSRQFRPIQGAQQVQVEVHHPSQTDVRPRESLAPRWRRSPGRLGPEAGVWGDGRHIHMAAPARGFLHPTTYPSRMSPSHGLVHYRRLEPPPVSAIQKVAVPRKQQEVYERLLHREPQLTSRQSAVDQQRPLATSSPPRLDRRVARVPPSPSKTRVTGKETEPKTVATTTRDQESSESSSGDQPMTYTRDRLLGAVERVRSGALHRGGPFRHSAPELVQAAREPTLLVPTTNAATPISRRGSPKRTVAAPTVASMGFRFIAPSVDVSDEAALPRSRTSITSGSSGRGSSGQGSKAASVTHSRGDSIQGELELSAANRSSSSSGFASRNLSATLHSSTSPGSSSLQPVPASSTVATSLAAPTATSSSSVPASSPSLPILELESPLDSPHSEPIFPSHMPPLDPLDVSVDENYEFDTVSPLESELLEKLRQYSQPHARSRSRLGSGERGLSDSELYTNFYPKSKVPRKYDNTEARCAALKEEFLQFRRRQQERRRSEELESAC